MSAAEQGSFKPRERAVLSAFARGCLDDPLAKHEAIAGAIELRLQLLPAEPRAQLLMFVKLLGARWFWFLRTGVARSLTTVTQPVRHRLLRGLAKSRLAPLRVGYQALRQLVMAAHYADERTWKALAYPAPKRLGRLVTTARLAHDASQRREAAVG